MSDGPSWAAVCARRLRRHALDAPLAGASPADAAALMCGAHAQIMSAAELSVGLRLAGATRADVRTALWHERSLVKTFGPRGTVHLLPSADLPMWTGALSALPATANSFAKGVRLTAEQANAVVAAIAGALEDAELEMAELSAAVVARAGPWAGELTMPAFSGWWPRWRQALTTAAHRGAVCFGADRGRRVTYTNPQRWLPACRPLDGPDALAELVCRYLQSYGPATPAHFARWLNAPRRWATQLFESLAGAIEPMAFDGGTAWVRSGDAEFPEDMPAGVRLLPYFDAYVVGGQPRELLYPGRAGARALAGGQAGNFAVLLIDGTVAGVWHQRRAGARIAVTVEPTARLPVASRRALEAQVVRLGEILEARATLTIGTVTVGAHA